MTITVRRRGIVAAVVAGALLMSGCSAGTASGGTDVEQTLRIAPAAFPVALDIQRYPAEIGVQNVANQVLESLVAASDAEVTGVLAEKWTTSDDGLTWTFTMRKATFSDGTAFTAEDARASIQRVIDVKGPLSTLFGTVTSLTADDDTTLTIVTSAPLGTLLNSLSLVGIGKGTDIESDTYWQKPIGTGPFTVSDYVADDHVDLARNESYWGKAPKLDSVEFVNMPEVSSRLTALETGEIDVTTQVPADQTDGLTGLDNISFTTSDSYQYLVSWFNHGNKALADTRVRQALTKAIDVESIVGDLYGDSAGVMHGPLTASVFGSADLGAPVYDLEGAKKLLAEAGYAKGLTLKLLWPNDAAANVKSLAQAFISAWADAGVTVEPVELERAQWLEKFGALEWDLTLFNNTTTTGDADYTLNRLYTCAAARMGYCDANLDKLLTQARESLDQDERADLYKQASTILWDNAVSLWPMEVKNNAAVNTSVEGFEVPASGRYDLSTVSRK